MKTIDSIGRWVGRIGIGVMLAMMLLTVADVFLRYAFSRPITGTTELTEMMMACLLLATVWCAVERRHITVGIVMDHLAPRVQAIVDSITLLAALGVYIILSWQGLVKALYSWKYHLQSSMIHVPEFPFRGMLALSLAVLCLVLIRLLIQKIAEAAKR
jgi:TRAP-type C4-dicarboxylate transport system permease small subunit